MKKKEFEPGTAEAMKKKLLEVKDVKSYKRIRCVYLGAKGYKAKEIAPIVEYSKKHVYTIWALFRKQGIEEFVKQTNGKNRSRGHLTREEEVGSS
jgi:transposase